MQDASFEGAWAALLDRQEAVVRRMEAQEIRCVMVSKSRVCRAQNVEYPYAGMTSLVFGASGAPRVPAFGFGGAVDQRSYLDHAVDGASGQQ